MIPDEKLNIHGGLIALVHPIGASECRIFVTLIRELIANENKNGLATLCIGSSMGLQYSHCYLIYTNNHNKESKNAIQRFTKTV